MRSIVIGLGETGGPLRDVLDCDGYDPKVSKSFPMGEYDALHICIPYIYSFAKVVEQYQKRYRPTLTVIHTTVPIGTTSKIKDAVHSPILGKHGNMKDSIRSFTKWVGGSLSMLAKDCFEDAGITVKCVDTSEETEAMKLMCLAKYGVYIAMAQYQKEICDKLNIPYSDVFEWDRNYNSHVAIPLRRPYITPPGDKIGGHCVTQNMPHLYKDFPSPLVKEVLKFA